MLSAPGIIRENLPYTSQFCPILEVSEESSSTPSTRKKPFLPPPLRPDLIVEWEAWIEDSLIWLQAVLEICGINCFKSYHNGLDYVSTQIDKAQVKQREDRKIELEKNNEAGKWGVARLTFTWMASLATLITGITLIATGVGVVAGCLMLIGGLIQIGSQIMELTGGWEKVRALLPGKDEDKKSAMTSWIQIGITILSLILSGAGVIIGGFSMIGENMQKASALMGAIALLGKGVSDIGEGKTKSEHKYKTADIKRREALMAKYKHRYQDQYECCQEANNMVESTNKFTTHQQDLKRDFANHVWAS